MSARTISQLVLKDWHLHRIAVLLTVGGSALAVVMAVVPESRLLNLSASLAVAVLISVIFYLPLSSVLAERDSKTLTFLMGLPVSPSEYVASKILGNLSIFLLPWLTVVAGVAFAPEGGANEALATGFVPVVLVGIVLGFSVVMAFALITESGGWTVALIVSLLFVTTNVLTELVPDTPAVQEAIQSIAAKGPAFHVALGIEALLIVSLLTATFVVQSRKRDFL